MQQEKTIRGSVLAAVAVAAAACYGQMDGTSPSDPVAQSIQQLAQKREWLKGYDAHCDTCFQAYSLCGDAAGQEAEQNACELAMNTCVRGGLAEKGVDAKADGDDLMGAEDVETGGEQQAKKADAGALQSGKKGAGVAKPSNLDAGAVEQDNVDVNAGKDVAIDEVDEQAVAEAEDAEKAQLKADIEECLVQVADCLEQAQAEADALAAEVAEVDAAEVDAAEVDVAEVDVAEVDAVKVHAAEADAAEAEAAKAEAAEVDAAEVEAAKAEAVEAEAAKVKAAQDAQCLVVVEQCVQVALEAALQLTCAEKVATLKAAKAPKEALADAQALCDPNLTR